MSRGPGVRGHQHVAVAVPAVDQGRAAQLARLASVGGEQQRGHAMVDVALLAAGLYVVTDVPGHPAGRTVEDPFIFPTSRRCRHLILLSAIRIRAAVLRGLVGPAEDLSQTRRLYGEG